MIPASPPHARQDRSPGTLARYDRPVIEFPPPAPGHPIRVSATLFVTFRRCPEQALARLAGSYPAETAAGFVGALAHRLFRRHLVAGPIADADVGEACREEIGSGLNEKMAALGVRRPSELRPLVERAGDLYKRFRTFGAEGFEGAEVEVRASPAEGVELVGIVDAVFRDEGLVLVDWKTGDLGDPESQLGFYALVWALERGEIPHRVEAVSVETGERAAAAVDEAVLARIAGEVSGMISALRAAGDGGLEARGGPWCRYCPVAEGCEEGTRVLDLLR